MIFNTNILSTLHDNWPRAFQSLIDMDIGRLNEYWTDPHRVTILQRIVFDNRGGVYAAALSGVAQTFVDVEEIQTKYFSTAK